MHYLALLNFTNFVASAGYGAIFVLCVLQSCCVPTSSELTLGFAGVLAAQGKLSLPGVIVAGVLGEVVGAYIAWGVGRCTGRSAVDRFGRYVLLSHRDIDRAQAWYERHGRFGVFGSRLMPVIRNFVALPAGIAAVPPLRFGALTAAGSLLWDGAWAGTGYGLAGQWHTIAKGFGDIGYLLAVLAAAAIAVGIVHRYRSYQEGTAEGGRGARAGGRWPGTGPPSRSGRHVREPAPATGAVRWVGSSSGKPPADRPTFAAAARANGWLGSSSGRPRPPLRDFAGSPVAAWESVVGRGRQQTSFGVGPLTKGDGGVESNGRLTAMLGAVLFVLLAIEGLTVLRITPLLTLHVIIGMVLVPVTVFKVGATTWRLVRYYLGSAAYRRRGPPPPLLRLLGPFVVVSTFAVVGSGIALLVAPRSLRAELLLLHQVTFVLWFAAMAIHVLGHLLDMAHLAPRDFYRRTRGQIRGAGLRQWAIVSAVCIGAVLGAMTAPKVGPWLSGSNAAHRTVPVHVHASSTSGSVHRRS